MDDDQAFVAELLKYIEDHETVNYRTFEAKTEDGGRDATITVELVAGDRYVITIREQHA